MNEFSIKTGDTSPAIAVQLLDDKREPRDLQNASNVTFSMLYVNEDELVVDDAPASIENESEAIVSYQWQDGDTDNVGYHKAEFEVEYDTGHVETFPNSGYIDVDIDEGV